ncbi:MAG: hypothetical protein ACK4N5_09965 [Myxococcales bacterium]
MKRSLLLVVVTLAGCTMALDFDNQEGLPCKFGRCLEGYACVNDVCVRQSDTEADAGEEPPPKQDAGTVVDAGRADAGGADAGSDAGLPVGDGGVEVSGALTGGGAAEETSGTAINGQLLWHGTAKGTDGRTTLHGWLR